MSHILVYHPETGEPFEVPEHLATTLRLEQGWLSHPILVNEAPAVQETPVTKERPVKVSRSSGLYGAPEEE